MSRVFEKLLVHLRRVSLAPANRGSDSELLSRFVNGHDMVAFEVLFWRHGPMVWTVCRRLLGNSADAEDAFQATFLVFVRKARSVGNGAALAGWLHRVARHTALNARKARSRRAAHEQPLAEHCEAAGQDDPCRQAAENELKAVIDQEIAQLPEKFRLPLILCDLEARSHESAAAELNCPVGTLHSRLARARAKLKDRLLRRGVSPMALPPVPVPLSLATAALHAVCRTPSAPVLALAQTVLWALTLTAAKKVAAVAAICCLLALGIAGGFAATRTGGKSRPDAAPVVAPIAQTNPDDKLNFIDPDAGPLPPDAVVRIGSTRLRHTDSITGLAYSPNGKWLASISTAPNDNSARLWDAATGREKVRVKVAVEANISPGDEFYVPRALGFAADSQQFLVVDAVSIRSFEIATGKELFAHPLIKDLFKVNPKIKKKANLRGALAARGDVVISPDGKTLVLRRGAIASNFEIRDIATGAVLNTGNSVSKIDYSGPFPSSHGGRRFALGNAVFDAISGQQIFEMQLNAGQRFIHQQVFTSGGETLIALVANEDRRQMSLAFFEVETGKLLRTVELDAFEDAIAISPDGKLLVTGNGGKLIDVATGKEIGRIPSTFRRVLAFSFDGKLLAWGGGISGVGAISVWDMASRRFHPTAAEPVAFSRTTFTSDGKALVVRGRDMPVVDWRTGKVIRRHAEVKQDYPEFNYLSPDEKLYAVPDPGGLIRLLDAQTGQEVRNLTGHNKQVGKIAFSRDGRRIASCGWDKVIRVWDVATGREIAQFGPAEVYGTDWLSFSETGRVLAASFNQVRGVNDTLMNNILYTWDVDAKAQLARIEAPQRFSSSATLSPDGRFLAGGGGTANPKNPEMETDVIIWNASSGKVIHSLPGHALTSRWPGTWCSFSPNSQLLVTADGAGRLRLWETLSGREVYRFEGHRMQVITAFFSPDGRLLVAASEDAPCFIWDVAGTSQGVKPLGAVDLEHMWRDLTGADAKKAFLAMRQLAAAPDPAVEVMRKYLKPRSAIDGPAIDKFIGDLDSSTFAVREAATNELLKIAEHIEPILAKARATASLEVRARLDQILEGIEAPSPERLRQSRALGALELISTPAAAKLLADLAAGNRYDSLTIAAAAASERLRLRGVK